jgi:hypothetical protein
LSGAPDFNELANGIPYDARLRKHRGSKRREVIGQIVALPAALVYAGVFGAIHMSGKELYRLL